MDVYHNTSLFISVFLSLPPRITCLMKLGRFDDCLSLTEAELHKSPMNISLLTTRAKLKMMFGNVR